MRHKRIFVPNQTLAARRSLPINARMTECAIQKNRKEWLVTTDLSFDFGLLKPVNVCKRELLVKTGRKIANSLAERKRYRASPRDIVDSFSQALRRDANWPWWVHWSFVSCFHLTRHSYHQMCQNIGLEWSCKILSCSLKDLTGNMIVTGLQSDYRANKLNAYKLIVYFMFLYNPELNVMFVLW